MKVYTKTGDKGKTSLFSGERISKSHDRVEAYGDLDELNSFLGYFLSVLPDHEDKITEEAKEIQAHLFTIGAWLATTPSSPNIDHLALLPDTCITSLEAAIDGMTDALPDLKAFILPGGSQAGALSHVLRTITRRVERRVVLLMEEEPVSNDRTSDQMKTIQRFLNRLSDYFFVLSRILNQHEGIPDVNYTPPVISNESSFS